MKVKRKYVLIMIVSIIVVVAASIYFIVHSDKSVTHKWQDGTIQDANNIYSQVSKVQAQPIIPENVEVNSPKGLCQETKVSPNSIPKTQLSDPYMEELLKDDLELVKTSGWMERRINEFYSKVTKEQLDKGEEILKQVHSTMGLPQNLNFKATFYNAGNNKLSYATECSYKYPSYYREDAKGNLEYTYVTDGVFEISDYMEKELGRTPTLYSRDGSSWMFLEMFPTRIMMDDNYAWLGEKKMDTSNGSDLVETEILGNWFYDVFVGKDDNLIHQVSYRRAGTNREMACINNIKYDKFEVYDEKTQDKTTYVLPVKYSIDFHDRYQTQTYVVELSYDKDFTVTIPEEKFYLTLSQKKSN